MTLVKERLSNQRGTTGIATLGIVQDLRRQYLEPGFPYHTNDLALAFRFYNLRKQYGKDPALSAELNRIFSNIVSGAVSTANSQLAGIESKRPVVYNVS